LGRIFGITGTPGTGKKTIAPMVASKLGVPCFSLNELAVSSGSFVPGSMDEVDTEALKVKLRGLVEDQSLVYGHLLPHILGKNSVAKVVVLRCEPRELKRRLMARGYPSAKVVENVEAELIGVVSADSIRVFGNSKVFELDTSSVTPRRAATRILSLLQASGNLSPRIDWTRSYDTASKLRSLIA
jgi:adenylate kinase